MIPKLSFIPPQFFSEYSRHFRPEWSELLQQIKKNNGFFTADFENHVVSSSVFSSNIEGNTLDMEGFMRNRGKRSFARFREVEEIENLVNAYTFARDNEITLQNLLLVHGILSSTLVKKSAQGKLRKTPVGVYDPVTGRPVYITIEPEYVENAISRLFEDIKNLLVADLTAEAMFYYASMIHLWIVKIHPFEDGNGRTARLLEKWFMVSLIGPAAWSVPSEKYYWEHSKDYYKNIVLGFNYSSLFWDKGIPFLLMLPQSILVY
jgi:Fic family protein